MLEQIIKLFEEVLERDPGSVSADDIFRDYEEWDSLAYLSVIAKIDEDFRILIPRDEFKMILTARQLAEYLEDSRE